MSTLHVRNVPVELYDALRERAVERHSSIASETVRLLRLALRSDRAGVRELLDEVEAERPRARGRRPTAAELVRADRDAR